MSERMRRVNESVREVVSEAIGALKDPRIGFVTVTGVDTSPDLRTSTIYVSVLGSAKKQRKSLEGLNSSAGALQEHLATELPDEANPATDVCIRSDGRTGSSDVQADRRTRT